MNQLLHVSASPHIKDRVTTSSIMLDVIIALIPATLFGIIQFKINALLIIVTTITTCVLAEYLYERFMKKTITIKDLSAVVTGLILALNLPSTVPLWLPIIGELFRNRQHSAADGSAGTSGPWYLFLCDPGL